MKVKLYPKNNHLIDNGYSIKEQGILYDKLLDEVLNNPRWYLNNLESLVEFRVSWGDYKRNKPVLPRAFIKERKAL